MEIDLQKGLPEVTRTEMGIGDIVKVLDYLKIHLVAWNIMFKGI